MKITYTKADKNLVQQLAKDILPALKTLAKK